MIRLTSPLLFLGLCIPAFAPASNETLPSSYIEFGQMAEELVAPLVPLMDETRSNFELVGLPSDHGLMADELDAFDFDEHIDSAVSTYTEKEKSQ